MPKPFIYIAALRRSGSNLLCEALTLPPHSYILREPGFARGRFAVKPNDAAFFSGRGVDLHEVRDRITARSKHAQRASERRRAGADLFIDDLLPRLKDPDRGAVAQIGIKEISHQGWTRYLERAADLGGIRIILLARDPRDIFLSLVQKARERKASLLDRLAPELVADGLNAQAAFQLQMQQQVPAKCVLRMRYEDFCTDPRMYQRIKDFVESDIPETGMIGGLNPHNARVHGGTITATSVRRWQRESDATLRAAANQVLGLMPAFAESWEYR